MNLSVSRRLEYFRIAILIFFISGIILSFPLWTHDRLFPPLPLFPNCSFLISPTDYIVLAAVLILFAFVLINFRKFLLLVILGLLALLVADDQNRLQAWVYVYALLLLGFSFSRDEESTMRCLRVIFIGIYVWSGIHKLNYGFMHGTFEGVLVQITGTDASQIRSYDEAGIFIPAMEMAIGLMLIIPNARKFAGILGALLHTLIITYLIVWAENSNFIVIPWNLAMIAGLCLLFWNTHDHLFDRSSLKDYRLAMFMLVAWCLPVLNFFGFWDHYTSFSYYSGKASAFYVALSDEAQKSIDKKVHKYFVVPNGVSGGTFLDMNSWSLGELHVPLVAQDRTFEAIRNSFCKMGLPEDGIYFFEVIPGRKQTYIRKTCGEE